MSPPSPSDFARAFFTALDQRQWHVAATMADPDWATTFQLRALAGIATSVQVSLEDPSASGHLIAIPSSHSELADLVRPYAEIELEGLPGIHTLGDLAALSPAEYLARHFEAIYHVHDDKNVPPRWEIVGEVLESDTLAYVLYRRSGSTVWMFEPGEVAVLYLRRQDGHWHYRLTRSDLTFPSLAPRRAFFKGRRIH